MSGINLNSINRLSVEVEKLKNSSRHNNEIEIAARSFLCALDNVQNGRIFNSHNFTCSVLRTNVNKISVFLSNFPADQSLSIRTYINGAEIFIYQNLDAPPCAETLEDGDDEQSTVVGSHHFSLPNFEFDGHWENLVFDANIKEKIINYANAMINLASKNIDPAVISSSRLVLFHGPPGTGKTTLCKAIAQKLTIRLSRKYSSAQLVEINSHSLFSKWFSESGKLVMKMFVKIHELLADENCLVFVLIDEVESLTKARECSLSSNEPSDALRVVNALLTQLDYIRRFPNVLILTTSNLSNVIDDAFLDRADIKQYVGPPSDLAIYKILRSCLEELRQKNLLTYTYVSPNLNLSDPVSRELYQISKSCVGLSGRTLRKLPVLACALIGAPDTMDVPMFLEGLKEAVKEVLSLSETNQMQKRSIEMVNGDFNNPGEPNARPIKIEL